MKIFFILSCFLFLVACGRTNNLKIATSANSELAIKKIAQAFEKEFNIEVDLIVSSSGALTTQLIHGAPYDLFLAADLTYPQKLYEKGLTVHKPKVYAYGKLVLWSLKEKSPSLSQLTSDKIAKIAISNPKTAPYGKLAKEVLIENEMYEDLKNKFVMGENVSQTNQFIVTKSADIGFTSLSTVLSEKMLNLGQWIEISDKRLAQGMVSLKDSKMKDETELFLNFLLSETSQSILNQFGYESPRKERLISK